MRQQNKKEEPERLQIGDTIQCRDEEDMVDTMQVLEKEGIHTDFRYELNGEKGLWLIVEGVERLK